MFDQYIRQHGCGRIVQQAAIAQFLFDEAEIIMLGGAANGVVIQVVRLHQYASGQFATAGAARDLGKQLKDAFGGAEVGQAERMIDPQHADQRDAVDVVAFGDHLRADQQIDFAAVQPRQNAFDSRDGGAWCRDPCVQCGHAGNNSCSRSSPCCEPTPKKYRCSLSHFGQCFGTVRRKPQ